MKRICAVCLLLLLLPGCGKPSTGIDRIMSLRTDILAGGCEFTAEVSADYCQEVHTFKMHCRCDENGNITFEVISPETIAGITGTLNADGGNFTFDDHALLFSALADGRLSPVSAPWVMMKAMRAGYISGCAEEKEGFEFHIDDSYQSDALQVIIRTDTSCKPISAEVCCRGSRILTISVEDFLIL